MPEPQAYPWHRPLLERALRARRDDRLPHAVLIDGFSERDLGGLTRYLAMLLLCDAVAGVEYCGQCEACRMMRGGTYADFTLVTLDYDQSRKKYRKNITIEQVRDLIYEMSLTRRHDRLKIAVLWPAETLSRAGANALLKTLEEPAPGVLLLLASHNPGRLPVTIRSRCQTWSVHAPPAAHAVAWLQEQGLEAGDAARHLGFARGDPVLALDLRRDDYAALVERFRGDFGRFLRGELAVSGLCRELARNPPPAVRRLLDMTLTAYCLQHSGVDDAANPVPGADPGRARELFVLRTRALRQLQTEDSNLDLQIQLEDVLISLHRILTRS